MRARFNDGPSLKEALSYSKEDLAKTGGRLISDAKTVAKAAGHEAMKVVGSTPFIVGAAAFVTGGLNCRCLISYFKRPKMAA